MTDHERIEQLKDIFRDAPADMLRHFIIRGHSVEDATNAIAAFYEHGMFECCVSTSWASPHWETPIHGLEGVTVFDVINNREIPLDEAKPITVTITADINVLSTKSGHTIPEGSTDQVPSAIEDVSNI